MNHLFVCREYPPAPYPPGGIGTYVEQMSRLLAERRETVHVIGHRWRGAPERRVSAVDGRLIIHRVALDQPVNDAIETESQPKRIREGLLASSCPVQTFAWQAALLAEQIVDTEGIDCIESQEWEAPLYYFLLRRELGLSRTTRRPACLVHLHSPSARIYQANRWDTEVADFAPIAAMEAYTVRHADALLAPSHFMAADAEALFAVPRERVSVIPYPVGDATPIARDYPVWSAGSICHVGRLEGRKGLFEWTEALAMAEPSVLCEFVGGDTPLHCTGSGSVQRAVTRTLPPAVVARTRFHGSQDRAFVRSVLARSWAAVVPSRWDNFPYSCVEAMASGVPVIASPNGGMCELIEDNVSGWIAADGRSVSLADALRRALATPADARAEMGAAAARRARSYCDNAAIFERQLSFRRGLVASRPAAAPIASAHLAAIVAARSGDAPLTDCLSSLSDAGVFAVKVVSTQPIGAGLQSGLRDGWTVDHVSEAAFDAATVAAARELLHDNPTASGIAYIDARATVVPEFGRICAALASTFDLGAGWAVDRERDHVFVPDIPTAPHRLPDGISEHFVFGTQALRGALSGAEPVSLAQLAGAVAARGRTITYPAVLVHISRKRGARRRRYSAMARGIQRLHTPLVRWVLNGSPDDRRALIERALRHPAQSAAQLTAPLRRFLRSHLGHALGVR